ncbi:MAG: aminotransferase class V-fold PLP-dependent enzyme [Planctomycetota bacterium]
MQIEPITQLELDATHGDLWDLEPGVHLLNHGSFGACPRAVLAHQSDLRARLERNTMGFMTRELEPLWDASRERLAGFLGCDAGGLAFVSNATEGVNAVVRSMALEPGDELLTADHEYRACVNALSFVAHRAGAEVVTAEVPVPTTDPGEIIERVVARVTGRTRLAMLSWVTSKTAQVWPMVELVRELEGRGIAVLVDAAHAPGMIEVDIASLGASYVTGNCHKWICAPKGSAFLWVREDRRSTVRPVSISHGATADRPGRTRYHTEFDWTGTDDPTPKLCVGHAIEHLEQAVPGGWAWIRERNRQLALGARALLMDRLGSEATCPPEMVGAIAAVEVPGVHAERAMAVQVMLGERWRAFVPFIDWADGRTFVRVSAQLYNEPSQYEVLAGILTEELPGALGG